ncbi:MAG: cytochrome c oxidase subunit II [Planctomycetota bacterium]|nr:cytochrome c oxidase subunit II [Planctomycetota bacterium]
MNKEFQLFPEAASSVASSVDELYFFLIGLTIFFSVLVAGLILYFAIKYRRGNRHVDRLQHPAPIWLELSWILFPIPILLFIFFWGASLFFKIYRPPDNATEITVVAEQWMWKLQQPSGRREVDTLHVPMNQPVRLKMISQDVIHSFYVPAFRLKQDVIPGRYSTLWFEPTKEGEFQLFCAEYCGTEHSQMIGKVVVMEPNEYQNWLAGGTTNEPPEVTGAKLFEQYRCGSCHTLDGTRGRGPSLIGIFGKQVRLNNGRVVKVDDDYIRKSIYTPAAQVVEGYQPIMPTYEGQLSEEAVMQIIAYMKSMTQQAPAAQGEKTE